MSQSRREFLKFLGRGAAVTFLATQGGLLSGFTRARSLPFTPLKPTLADGLNLADGFNYEVLIRYNDPLGKGLRFGFNNDYTAFYALNNANTDGILWVNHEYTSPMFVHEKNYDFLRTPRGRGKDYIDKEMATVGGSLVRVKKQGGSWKYIQNDGYNRRFDANTKIPFAWSEPIQGSRHALGTFANCAGGYTPWGTVLTCEENYDQFFGERNLETGEIEPGDYQWERWYNRPPEHYGWVVEIDFKTGEAHKLVAMGRCAHECATVHELADGRCVVYTADDANDECLYKFVGDKPGSIKTGTLYVANVERGEWIKLDHASNPTLQKHFKSQTEVLTYLRKAADLLGGSKLNRPEDVEVDPQTGAVYVALTNNKPKGDYHGSILKIDELGDYTSRAFKAETFLAGGPEVDFSCPDNLAFDEAGNLWFTSDMSGSQIGKNEYEGLGNNGLFYVPMSGPDAGGVFRVASAPVGAEFTGPTFAGDGETLFLSVQHPGETTSDIAEPTSHWPNMGTALPKPAVVAISGNAMRELLKRNS